MTANPFDLSPSAPAPAALCGSRFALTLVATLLLSGLLASSIDLLTQYLFLPDAGITSDTGESLDWLPRYDAFYFLTIAANRLSDLWIIGLSGWLIVGYLFERNGQIGYRRPRPLLVSLLLISLGLTLVVYVLLRFLWAFGFELMNELDLRIDAVGILVRLTSAVTGVLQWAVSVPLAIWLSLHFFRSDALAGPLRQVGRSEAAWLAALCTGLGTLTLLGVFAKPFNFLGDLETFASYYGIGIVVTLAAFVGARMALPARLNGLRPLDLLAASLVNVASLALFTGGAAVMLMLITYGRQPSNTWLVVLGIVSLPLCALMQLFCMRVIYRPLAA